MHTPGQHRWTISGIDDIADHRSGNAAALTDAWTAALTAGRVALLAAELKTLAVRIDGELEALYSPGRDDAGMLDRPEITAGFVEMLLDVTAAALAEQLIAE
jgi:hypothetical protein